MRHENMGFSDAVASAGPYANNLHLAADRQTDVDQHLIAQFYSQQMLFLTPNRVKALRGYFWLLRFRDVNEASWA